MLLWSDSEQIYYTIQNEVQSRNNESNLVISKFMGLLKNFDLSKIQLKESKLSKIDNSVW
jgi:hypothetical protein